MFSVGKFNLGRIYVCNVDRNLTTEIRVQRMIDNLESVLSI